MKATKPEDASVWKKRVEGLEATERRRSSSTAHRSMLP